MIDMKKLLFILSLLPLIAYAKAPEWVSQTPSDPFYYWAVGISPLTNPNAQEVAQKQAIDNIAQQISVNVESNSFLNISEVDYTYREEYQKQMRLSTQNYIEDIQVYDTYQDKKFYYVCYRLSKSEYKASITRKSESVASQAYQYLNQAQNSEADGNLIGAIDLYRKGLEIVEPWLYLDLVYQNVNVPVALYSGYKSLFDGLTMTVTPQTTTIQNLKAVNIEIVAQVEKRGVAIKNLPLIAKFNIGAGNITPSQKTDNTGKAHFYLTQVSSKEKTQLINIQIDNTIFHSMPKIFNNALTISQLPVQTVNLTVEQQNISLYINSIGNGMPQLVRQIASVLGNQNFNVTTNLQEATHIMDVATKLNKGSVVRQELGNLQEWTASLVILLKDKQGNVITQYNDEDVRVLTETDASNATAAQRATTELTKHFKRTFPKQLQTIDL